MPNLYNKSNPSDLRDLPQSLIDTWVEVNNPKLQEWLLAPAKPTEDAVWSDGQWVTPPAPTFTAEDWTALQGYSGHRPTTLLYQKLRLDAAGKSSPKLAAVQGWLDAMISSALAPAASDWPPAPHTFEDTLAETLATLTAA